VIVDKRQDNTFQFLSGVAITSNTKFLDVNHPVVAEEIRTLIHFLHYGLAVYGWPIFMMMNSATGCCQLFPHMKCCTKSTLCCLNCSSRKRLSDSESRIAVEDNCCQCNYAALKKMCQTHNYELIYATYHVAIGEPPFFVALDYDKRSVVISVRGTLSLHDVSPILLPL
jgi:sn1-specific diacylglycerol lipase